MVARAKRREHDSLSIGQLARATGYTDKTLRYYDHIGLLPPTARTPAGYRLYGPAAIERLRFVRDAQSLGLSLDDIQQILGITDAGGVPCDHTLAVLDRQLGRIASHIDVLTGMQTRLRSARRRVARELRNGPSQRVQGCGCLYEPTREEVRGGVAPTRSTNRVVEGLSGS